MSDTVIQVDNLSKQYRLGLVGTGALKDDVKRLWAKVRGREDPYATVGQVNDRTVKAAYDWVWALKDINIEIRRGDVVGLIGKNGAGKSTLLKLISRITAPTQGCIRVKGRIASLLEVGTGMHPEMTAGQNIFLNGAILGMTRAEIRQKFEAIVEFAGCQLYVDTPVKRYSSGMRVRLGFAVAAFLEPEILVVDEVLAVGDAEFQAKAIGKMREVAAGGKRTILFVSHNMNAVSRLCEKGIVLEHGGVSFVGTARDAISHYFADPRRSTEGRVSWPAAVDRDVKIRECRIEQDRVVKAIVETAKEITVGIDVEASTDIRGFLVCHFRTSDGVIALFCDSRDAGVNGLRRGLNRLDVIVPARCLSAGTYTLSVGVSTSLKEALDREPDCISVTFVELDVVRSDNPGISGQIPEWRNVSE